MDAWSWLVLVEWFVWFVLVEALVLVWVEVEVEVKVEDSGHQIGIEEEEAMDDVDALRLRMVNGGLASSLEWAAVEFET